MLRCISFADFAAMVSPPVQDHAAFCPLLDCPARGLGMPGVLPRQLWVAQQMGDLRVWCIVRASKLWSEQLQPNIGC